MDVRVIKQNDIEIAYVISKEELITDVQSALDLMATVSYETGCNRLILVISL